MKMIHSRRELLSNKGLISRDKRVRMITVAFIKSNSVPCKCVYNLLIEEVLRRVSERALDGGLSSV